MEDIGRKVLSIPAVPIPAQFDETIQSWDIAFEDQGASDYVVGQFWGACKADRHLLNQVRNRWDMPATKAAVQELSRRWPGPASGRAPAGLAVAGCPPDCNLLVFEHSCGSSISVLARRLRYLLPEPESDPPLPVLFGASQCQGHCRFLKDLEGCVAPCGNVRDRTLILLVQCLKKAAEQSAKAEIT